MKTKVVWKEKMKFTGELDQYRVEMDAHAPIGNGSGFTPKELVALGIGGCTAMDVVALLKKYKEPLESLSVEIEVVQTEKIQPAVFKDVALVFVVTGQVNKDKLTEAVRLSQTKYCGVSAMIVKTAPIHYRVVLNQEEIATGEASFGVGN
jgi:putative redox protein